VLVAAVGIPAPVAPAIPALAAADFDSRDA